MNLNACNRVEKKTKSSILASSSPIQTRRPVERTKRQSAMGCHHTSLPSLLACGLVCCRFCPFLFTDAVTEGFRTKRLLGFPPTVLIPVYSRQQDLGDGQGCTVHVDSVPSTARFAAAVLVTASLLRENLHLSSKRTFAVCLSSSSNLLHTQLGSSLPGDLQNRAVCFYTCLQVPSSRVGEGTHLTWSLSQGVTRTLLTARTC